MKKLLFCITEQIDDPVVVACKQSNQVSEEEHKCRVDDAVGQIRRTHFEIQQGVNLSGQHGQGLQQLLSFHLKEKEIKFYSSAKN